MSASSFKPATEHLTIGSVDRPKLTVKAQYNPKELQVEKAIPWSKANQSNQSNNKGIHLEFTGAEGRTMTVEMLFDGYEDNKSIAGHIKDLEDLASVITPDASKEDERRPHRCTVSWGGGNGLPRFDCVIEHISTKYTMFSSEGVPLRATCTVKLKEANVVSMKKAANNAGGNNPPPAEGA